MTVQEIAQRRAAIDVEIKDVEAQAVAHEKTAVELRLKRTELRKVREGLSIAMLSEQVQQRIATSEQAAAQHATAAAQHAADLEKLKAELAMEAKRAKTLNDALEVKLKERT